MLLSDWLFKLCISITIYPTSISTQMLPNEKKPRTTTKLTLRVVFPAKQWISIFTRSDWLPKLGISTGYLLFCKTQWTRASNHLPAEFWPDKIQFSFFNFCRWLFTGLVYTKQLLTSVSVNNCCKRLRNQLVNVNYNPKLVDLELKCALCLWFILQEAMF